MSSGQYSWYSGDFSTGRIYGKLPLVKTQWADVMDDSGTLSGTAKLRSPDVAALNVPSLAAEGKCFLAVAYEDPAGNETFLQAGQIWSHDYDDDTGNLTISAAGAMSYWDHRKLVATSIADAATNTASAGGLAFAGWSLGTIAKKMLQAIAGRPNGTPPVIYQADEAQTSDVDHSRTFNGWDLTQAGDALRNLTQVDNGPEISFRPRRKASDGRFLEWFMATGTETRPLLVQTGPDWVFDSTIPKSPVAGISVKTDATQMGDAAWSKGNGSEVAALIGVSIGTDLTGLGYPFMEIDVPGHDDVESKTTIYRYAKGGRQGANRRLMTVTFKAHRDASPPLSSVGKGDWVQLVVGPNHPYLAAGTIRARIVQRSGDDSAFVSYQLGTVFG